MWSLDSIPGRLSLPIIMIHKHIFPLLFPLPYNLRPLNAFTWQTKVFQHMESKKSSEKKQDHQPNPTPSLTDEEKWGPERVSDLQKLTAKIQDPLDLGAVRTPTRGSTVVISFTATCRRHSTARKQVTRPGERQHRQQNRLDFIAGKLQRPGQVTVSAGTTIAERELPGPRSVWKAGEDQRPGRNEKWGGTLVPSAVHMEHYRSSKDSLEGSCRAGSGKPTCWVGLRTPCPGLHAAPTRMPWPC